MTEVTFPVSADGGSAMTVTAVREGTSNELLERLQDPQVAQALVALLDRAELLAVLVEGLDQFVARSEEIGDAVITGVAELRETVAANSRLSEIEVDLPRIVDTATRLAGSDLVDPAAVDQISLLARGLVAGGEAFAERPVPVQGLLSLNRILRDPDVRRAVSFLATVAKSLGQELAAAAPKPPTT
ncbi:MAG TPA: DUF1641 domain-containing protein [Nocardioides sp.]|uniref:DUF1641 domain-containing protein n=1 Tax=uncultured Nocardioides sp. TaxID=198441 RepID=UPI00262A32B6|nr:DUF1641 domain-containing protein [uncultured Nocardioides sp.]HRD62691.1 DUF1641 domain-containing protein [Nocardioides sp.]HRI96413.1 DUF1641 domain-containing protein [Nocardioides sp.]